MDIKINKISEAARRGDWPTVLRLSRQEKGWTQGQLATQAGCDRTTISNYERGSRTPSRDDLHRLASILEISPRMFGLADPHHDHDDEGEDDMRRRQFLSATAAGIGALTIGELAVTPPAVAATDTSPAGQLALRLERILAFPDSGTPVDPKLIPQLLRAARSDYRNTQYVSLTDRMSTLVATVENGVATSGTAAAHASAAETYLGMTRLLFKLPVSNLEWISTDRALQAARRADDPLLVAECQRQQAIAYRRLGRNQTTVDICTHAADLLMRASDNHATQAAHLFCTASYAAAHLHDQARATELIGEARRLAAIPTTAERWDAFSSVANVDVYNVSVATVLGDLGNALKSISQVPLGALASTERKARFLVDATAARLAAGQRGLAKETLAFAHRIAPQEVANRPAAEVLAQQLGTGRRSCNCRSPRCMTCVFNERLHRS